MESIRFSYIIKELLTDDSLNSMSLQKAVDIANIFIGATHNVEDIHEGSTSQNCPSSEIAEEVNNVKQIKRSSSRNHHCPCSRCGFQHASRKCPAHGKICSRCGGINHFAKICFKNKIDTITRHDSDNSDLKLGNLGNYFEIN